MSSVAGTSRRPIAYATWLCSLLCRAGGRRLDVLPIADMPASSRFCVKLARTRKLRTRCVVKYGSAVHKLASCVLGQLILALLERMCVLYMHTDMFCRAMRVHVCDVAHSAVGTLGGCNVCTACSPRKGLPHELLLRVLGTKSSLRLWIGSATSGGGDSLVVGAIVVPLVSVVAAADPAEELVILSSNFCNLSPHTTPTAREHHRL